MYIDFVCEKQTNKQKTNHAFIQQGCIKMIKGDSKGIFYVTEMYNLFWAFSS